MVIQPYGHPEIVLHGMPICPAESYTMRYGLRTAIAIHWFDGSSILEYNMTTCCYGPLKEDLAFLRMFLISSKRYVIACVREDFPLPFIWPAEDRTSRRPPPLHMASQGLDVEMFLTRSYGQPSTTPRSIFLPFVKQPGSTATENKFTPTAKFRKQRHGRVHLGATGGPLFPDASTTV